MKKKLGICGLLLLMAGAAFAQTQLQNGVELYGQGKWGEAIELLRQVQGAGYTDEQKAEAVYWLVLAEIASADYEAAARDMSALERMSGGAGRKQELPYQKGRILYHMGSYDDALVLLKTYADRIPDDTTENIARKSAALYWVGECLYALGHFDTAHDIFFIVVQKYPQSAKYEAASYRIALINQKKIEAELLDLLKWTHEESLKTVEEYQRRERTYDQALIAYQKRIAAL